MIATLGATSLIMIAFVILIWIWYLRSNNPGVIDVCWSLGIFICASAFLLIDHPASIFLLRSKIAWCLLLLWAARLSGFLWFTRISKNHRDPRYEAISNHWKISRSLGFLLNYILQGFLMMMIALPFLSIAKQSAVNLLITDYLAMILVCIGLVGESIADWQLYQFKRSVQGIVCEVGLWNYSRHPNYFFEWVIWLGFSLFGISSHYGFMALISPIVLLVIFVFVTGPITERQSLKSKGELFLAYQKSTSFIFPWFKR